VVDRFRARLGGRLRLSAGVVSVAEREDLARVTYRERGRARTVSARTVILTPPGPAARELIREMSGGTRKFLSSLKYGEGTVIALGWRGAGIADFRYIVTPDLPTSTVLRQRTGRDDTQVLFVYYAGEKSARLRGRGRERIIRETLASVRRLGIGSLPDEKLLFTDLQRWLLAGPVISRESYASWEPSSARPSRRVFLGGEYVHVSPRDLLPYGLAPALRAGMRAARQARGFLLADGF